MQHSLSLSESTGDALKFVIKKIAFGNNNHREGERALAVTTALIGRGAEPMIDRRPDTLPG